MADPSYEDVMTALRAADAAGNSGDAEKLAAIASRLSKQSQPQPSKYDPSQPEDVYQANRVKIGSSGLLSLPADVVKAGADVVSSIARKAIPGYAISADYLNSLAPDFVMQRPSDVVKGALADPNMKAPSRSAEIRGGISEFAGAGMLPSMAVVGRAAHKIPAIVGEIGSTALGGMGSEIAGLPGAIVGGVAGLQTPVIFSKAYSLVSGAVPWLRAKNQAAAPAELTAAISAHPASAKNIQAADEVKARIAALGGGEFNPTLAGQTGAPGIIAREHQIAGSTPEELSRYSARYGQNEAAIAKATDTAFPQGGDIRRTADSIRRGVASELEARLDKVNKAREQIAQRFSTNPQQSAGYALEKLRSQAHTIARNTKNAKIEDVYATADKLKVEVDMSDVLGAVRKIGGSDENIFQNMPPVYQKILSQYGAKKAELTGRSIPPDIMAMQEKGASAKPATFRELHSLWREANTQYAAAMRSGDSQSQYYLQQIKESLRGKLERFEQEGVGELSAKFKDFNRFYAVKYAPAFKEGVGGRMDASGRYGDVVLPETVVSKFFTPSGIDDFNLIYGGNKDAQAVLADGISNMFRQVAVRNGKIDPKAAQAFIRSNEEVLNKLPDIKAVLQNRVAANEALLESGARVREGISNFNKSAVAKIAKTDNPDALIDKALTDRRSLMQLTALGNAGGESAANAVARAIADRIPFVAERQRVDPLSFVSQNESLLKPALDRLGKDHFENLKTIAGARTIQGRTEIPKAVGVQQIGDVVEQITGSTPRTIWAQSVNTTAGRQSPVSASLHLLSKYGIKVREDNATALMREAIYNPEVAASWAKLAKGRELSIPESNSLLNHFAAAGIRISEYRPKDSAETTPAKPIEKPVPLSDRIPGQAPSRISDFVPR